MKAGAGPFWLFCRQIFDCNSFGSTEGFCWLEFFNPAWNHIQLPWVSSLLRHLQVLASPLCGSPESNEWFSRQGRFLSDLRSGNWPLGLPFHFPQRWKIFGGFCSVPLPACVRVSPWLVQRELFDAPSASFVSPEQQINCHQFFSSSFVRSPGDPQFLVQITIEYGPKIAGFGYFLSLFH